MTRLTRARLAAIIEALIFRECGEMDETACPVEDYEAALSWALGMERKRYGEGDQ